MISLVYGLYAQFDVISTGTGYTQFSYYDLESGNQSSLSHSSWDIAFSINPQSAGILLNEGAGSSMGQSLPEFHAYLAVSDDFVSADTVGMTRIYNDDVDWNNGAFNHVRTPGSPFDFGWGSYNPATHVVSGTRLFFIKLRSGEWKKIFFESLANNTIIFKYANLDGSNEIIKSINRSAYSQKTLIFYSFESNEIKDLEPNTWDFMLTRYRTPVSEDDLTLNYLVTGVLLNKNTKAVRVAGVDPESVLFEDYEAQLTDSIRIIGHDWKSFNLDIFQWELPSDLVYFVSTMENLVWKLQFVDFEGSATGNATLMKTFVGSVSSVGDIALDSKQLNVWPNPSDGNISFEFDEIDDLDNLEFFIYSIDGKLVQKTTSLIKSEIKY